jgi:hypothetical protein
MIIKNRISEFVIPSIKQINADGKRTYLTPSGESYPSLTGVTGLLGRDGIKAWRARVGEAEANRISRMASSRGTSMHTLAEHYILDDTEGFSHVSQKAMPDAISMFNSLKKVLDGNLEEILAVEAKLWSDELEVAGTVDCIGKYMAKYAVMDWKTSRKEKSKGQITNYFCQGAGYAKMWEERTGMKIDHVLIFIATEETGKTHVYHAYVDDYINQLRELREQFRNENKY